MKTKELESKVKLLNYESKWNFSIENRCDAITISISKNGQGLYRIPNKLVGSVHEFGSALEIPEHDRLALQKLAYKYSRTPLDEREDEPKFQVKLLPDDKESYLNLDELCSRLFMANRSAVDEVKTVFTQSEYDKLQQKYPEWLPKFDKNDPHFEIVEGDD